MNLYFLLLFSLILTGYLYTIPPEQDTKFIFKLNLLWINTIVLFFVASSAANNANNTKELSLKNETEAYCLLADLTKFPGINSCRFHF